MTEHSYIDEKVVHCYDNPASFDEIWDDVSSNITGICDDDGESMTYLCDALYDDLRYERANYKAYIEEGMSARMMMSLRISALMLVSDKMKDFYRDHRFCQNYEDVKQLRIRYLSQLGENWYDMYYQLYFLLIGTLGYKGEGLLIDYELCFDDGIHNKQTDPDFYEMELLRQRFPKEEWGWRMLD